MQLLISIAGILVLILCAWAFSENKKAINWRTVGGALFLQAGFAALVLYIPIGQKMLGAMSDGVAGLLSFADVGIQFVFGDLSNIQKSGFVFAIRVLPLVIFISALISLLYYLGVMQWIIKVLGGGIQKALGTSRAESLVATGNIFLSQGESPLLVKPFLSQMTRSELFVVMTCGMASVAGSVLGGYAGLGVDLKYLIAASFMAAPGGLLMAKILVPETGTPVEQTAIEMEKSDHSNAIDALAAGAMNGMKVSVAIGTMLIAFVSVIAMVNAGLESVGEMFGFAGMTMQKVLGYVFSPLAFVAGVPAHEMLKAGSFIGEKLILNEFVAFMDFANVKQTLSEHTQVIITFALCGFANIGSIAIQIGSIGAMAPDRRSDVANLGFRAVLAATLANLMSAALAGIFISL
ncbi:TPA: NupC/NupG family nucleoside CNT transporter [Photobacterium damselae]|uniref:Nucleoside permease n=5 Tax=Photobacterium damselae TaxID=38293 RepID=A0A2T3IC53_PHODM|nr:NupC/NupG family nucleoside CNT transporter [Photobacterium damselae]ARR51594.1 NupC/NupG family nucleoside CNT transporter [Photobacterium damselae subsp. damselae]AWK84013.1 transporter [Photobacterium damselae]EJN6961106.1 NupC/NupG family nucleoside CNT transporter [Photobacterium damselae]ELI6449706.1 NupC/NupG family nucleoside CNT transporter [Photobacterium damselae]ELV7517630.1 NupC/NupG family nucleoside CNT transporter [Photobacterium damselae]